MNVTPTANLLAADYALPGEQLTTKPSKRESDEAIITRAMAIIAKRMKRTNCDAFSSPGHVKSWLCLNIGSEMREVFTVVFLDAQNRLIESRNMFYGTLTQTSVYPREVVRAALEVHAASVVLSHNHPSGTTQPSRADEALTQTLKAALALVDVRVLDHIIVSGTDALSMAEKGLL